MTQQDLIRPQVEQRGLSWYMLAKITGIPAPTLHHFKRGRFQFRDAAIVNALADALDLDADTIYLAGNHVPDDIAKGLIQYPELLPIVRNLITRIQSRQP